MNSLTDLEKKINSELTTKINDSKMNHGQLYIEIDSAASGRIVILLKII